MILELAFAAGCRYIVTHNTKDFRGSERLGTVTITPTIADFKESHLHQHNLRLTAMAKCAPALPSFARAGN